MSTPYTRKLLTLALPLALVAISAPRANAQDLDAKSAARLKAHYMADLDSTHAKIMALANAIPEDKYGWRPAPGVRSVSEVLMHLVGEWDYYAPMSVAGKPPADFGSPREALPALEKITGKAAILAQLEKSWAYCHAQLVASDASAMTGSYKPWGVTLEEAAFGMTGDQHEHLGQLIAYARSVGVKPPWSAK